jgi:hypothetical protein
MLKSGRMRQWGMYVLVAKKIEFVQLPLHSTQYDLLPNLIELGSYLGQDVDPVQGCTSSGSSPFHVVGQILTGVKAIFNYAYRARFSRRALIKGTPQESLVICHHVERGYCSESFPSVQGCALFGSSLFHSLGRIYLSLKPQLAIQRRISSSRLPPGMDGRWNPQQA